MDDQVRAERATAAMLEGDAATAWFGIETQAIGPGHACMALVVGPQHLNGHGICHGAVIFALADTAFAMACNSDNHRTVAQHNQISYLSPAQLGERLLAEARVIHKAGKSGLTDVTVTAPDGRVVALFRGASRRIPGQHVEES